jgi:hypothetical protein
VAFGAAEVEGGQRGCRSSMSSHWTIPPSKSEESAKAGYYETNEKLLEHAMTNAVNDAFEAEPDDIITFVAERLLAQQQQQKRRHGTRQQWPYGEAQPDGTASRDVAAAVRLAKAAEPPKGFVHARAASARADEEWSVESWLGDAIASPVAEALLRPLGEAAPSHVALEFVRALCRSEAAVRSLLDDQVLDRLSAAVCAKAATLSGEGAMSAHELSSKFAESTFTLSYGGLDTFFSGLEGRLGAPNPNLHEAMEREHCASADSHAEFQTPNYGVKTTSAVEWWVVVEPTPARLLELGLDSWPGETHSCDDRRRRDFADDGGGLRPLSAFERPLAEVNVRLAKLDQPEVLPDELIGGRI